MELKEIDKKDEVGFLPNNWKVVKIGNVFEFKNGLNKEKSFFGYGIPIINYMDVYRNNKLTSKDIVGKVNLTNSEIKNYEIKKGDVLFTRTSETPEEIGISAVVMEDLYNTVFSGFLLRARPINKTIAIDYCKYCFTTKAVRKEIISKSSYTTRALTNGRLLSSVKLVIPNSLSEQTAIATALSDADALISSLEKLIDKKRKIKQGVMKRLLKPKVGWAVEMLDDECELITKGTTPTSVGRDFQSSGISFIKIESLTRTGKIIKDKTAFIDLDTHLILKRSQLKVGDLSFSIAGALGRVAMVEKDVLPANTNQALAIVRLKHDSKIHLNYLFHYLNSEYIQRHIINMSVQGAQANLSLLNIAQLPIGFPSYSEQVDIGQIIDDIEVQIEILEMKLNKFTSIKSGMMQNLLTGTIRLVKKEELKAV